MKLTVKTGFVGAMLASSMLLSQGAFAGLGGGIPLPSLFNGSFEDGPPVEAEQVGFGWLADSYSLSTTSVDSDWLIQSGGLAPLDEWGAPVAQPTDGLFAAMTTQLGPSQQVMFQDIAVPPGGGTLSCDISTAYPFYLVGGGEGGPPLGEGPPPGPGGGPIDGPVGPGGPVGTDYARADIMPVPIANPYDLPEDGVLQNFFYSTPNDAPSSYKTITTNLDAYAGQVVRLQFSVASVTGPIHMGVDNCVFPAQPLVNVSRDLRVAAIRNKRFEAIPDSSYPAESTAGVYSFTATFCNVDEINVLSSLLARTRSISGFASLVSRDSSVDNGGVGSEQNFERNMDYSFGELSPGGCVDVDFHVGLTQKRRFGFRVNVWGVQTPSQLR